MIRITMILIVMNEINFMYENNKNSHAIFPTDINRLRLFPINIMKQLSIFNNWNEK